MASSTLRSVLLSIPLFISLLLSSTSSSSAARCGKEDKKVLLAIKSFWGNPDVLTNWNSTRGCCDWTGIQCDPINDRVIGLAVYSDPDLSGTIPPAVGDLPFLTSLDFRMLPNLVGPIIPAIARLSRLAMLRLDSNGLSGPVPSFLTSFADLEYVDLSSNRLTGSIPPGLLSIPKLRYLRLDTNRLTGSIPDSFGKLPPGVFIYLSQNSLTGTLPKTLCRVDFSVLDLSGNKLSGDASPLFRPWNASFDQHIRISRNKFEFDLSKVEFPLKLIVLDISHNRIYGSIPRRIVKVPLQYLNVSSNRLCGKIPTGGNMGRFDESSYVNNKCLCGTPLPPCK